jgi:hypothetical protein
MTCRASSNTLPRREVAIARLAALGWAQQSHVGSSKLTVAGSGQPASPSAEHEIAFTLPLQPPALLT